MQRLKEKERIHPEDNWSTKLALHRTFQQGKLAAFFDTSAGFTYADKSCIWARHLAEKAGVHFVLGPETGKLDDLLLESTKSGKKVRGLRTADGKEHYADVTIVATGGWTPSLVPEVEGMLETTAGSVTTFQIPRERKDLWDKVNSNHKIYSFALVFRPWLSNSHDSTLPKTFLYGLMA
jgi:sarcosine oxidase / L-pipecolate oxidase